MEVYDEQADFLVLVYIQKPTTFTELDSGITDDHSPLSILRSDAFYVLVSVFIRSCDVINQLLSNISLVT